MIGYTLVGTNDKERAHAFYDALFESTGARRIDFNDRVSVWSQARGKPMFGVSLPYDGEAATSGNGTMIAVLLENADQVAALHAKAIELGGTNEGDVGPRGGGQMTFGYFRDLDGNKIAFHAPS